MKEIIKNSLQQGMTYQAYIEFTKFLVSEGKSTGPEQTEQRVAFTKLNSSRMRRLDKTITIPNEVGRPFQEYNERQTWLVILESWCADGAQTIPILNKICETNHCLELKIVFRDDHPELMDLFLTNGTRSVPKLIVLNDALDVINTWGPRSETATGLVESYKSKFGKIDDAFKKSLQIWYTKNRGEAIIEDLLGLMKEPISLMKN